MEMPNGLATPRALRGLSLVTMAIEASSTKCILLSEGWRDQDSGDQQEADVQPCKVQEMIIDHCIE